MSRFLFLPILILFFSTRSNASIYKNEGAYILNPSAYSFKYNTQYFMSTGVIDKDGVYTVFPDTDSFNEWNNLLTLSYGLSKTIELNGNFNFRMVNGSNSTGSMSASGPESFEAQMKYLLHKTAREGLILDLRFRQTLFTNHTYLASETIPQDDFVLGDDGSEYRVGSEIYYLMTNQRLDFSVHYVSPPNNLSAELEYNMKYSYQFSKMMAYLGLKGIYSLNGDDSNGNLDIRPKMATGPSGMYNSVNRQMMKPYFGLDIDFKKITLTGFLGTVLNGRSTDKGQFFGFGIQFFTEGITPESEKVNSFKEYTIEGSVLKVSARGNHIKIDQGISTDVEKGMKFDIYQTDYFGGNELVGTGEAIEVGADWSVIKIEKKYKNIEIKPGFQARGN